MTIFRRQKKLLILAGALFALPILLFATWHPLASLVSAHLAKVTETEVADGVNQELQTLAKNTTELVAYDSIRTALLARDAIGLLGITSEEAAIRNIDNISVVDQHGVLLSRTAEPDRRGNYVFQTTPWGESVAQGNIFVGIEQTNGSPVFRAGAPIIDHDAIIGGLFASRTPTDAYAKKFASTYLNAGTEIAFFSLTKGIVATSFSDSTSTALLSTHFGPQTAFMRDGDPMWTESFHLNDRIYLAHHVPLYDSTHTLIGCIIIFDPAQPGTVAILGSMSSALLFFVLALWLVAKEKKKIRQEATSLIPILSVVIFTCLFVIITVYINLATPTLTQPPFALYNSILAVEPDSGVMDTAFQQKIEVVVSPGGEAINTIHVVLNYDTSTLTVRDIFTDKSICSPDFFFHKEIDAVHGRIVVTCFIPNPGFTGIHGIVADLIVQPKQTGPFALTFAPETQVLANDGLGTDVLRQTINGGYFAIQGVESASSTPAFFIFSPSHPNHEAWYSNHLVTLSWGMQTGDTYRYRLDSMPNTIPDSGPATTTSPITIIVPDGAWYIHVEELRGDKLVGVAHYHVQIDTLPPPPPIIKTSSDHIKQGELVRFELKNEDLSSDPDLLPGFFISINGGTFFPTKTPLAIPFVSAGTYHITVRVFDQAGNWNDASTDITVQ